ncbi:type I secretion system permease/ATPase [Methylosinus sp. H3A]|uniref:type I secretion system permease/ATPase n=1 Tax=Methylosinus sp. H3A TaxID=2785786 RepID=UPI0018C2EE9F|nr:type I secretion system permease/ATPase [Methylosinus sp. H3A]MBG0811750.1 type I secretion system permease/ATPase [Methylosinus sp. H3A]
MEKGVTGETIDSGLQALCGIAAYYRIPADAAQIRRELALSDAPANSQDLLRAALLVGLKARIVTRLDPDRLAVLPAPSILRLREGAYQVFGGRLPSGLYRIVDPITRIDRELTIEQLVAAIQPEAILIARKLGGTGVDPQTFGFKWFLPSIWRYRRPLAHVILASFFVQIFALVTPLFFQVVIDKVLSHKGYDTLFVLVGGLAVIGIFDVVLQYLRTYALSHTTNRIDVELGRRLFYHLFRLPMQYFETRSAGQTVARVRELETIRSFLTGQGLFSALDIFFTIVFIIVLLAYSWKLTLIVLASVPLYLLIAFLVRPVLRELINEKFNRGAESQQMLVEAIVGVQTIKASAVEPAMQMQWEEKLAAYVSSSFDAGLVGAGGQSAIQYVTKLTSAALLLFGAKAVIDGELSVGELVAFNMIAGQVAQPILRLSQIWQDFQQVQISIDRLGDILNVPTEPLNVAHGNLPPAKGAIELRNVTFRYRPGAPEALKNVSLTIRPGEVIGIVGRSGSGKSTLTKLIQRFYLPEEGQVLVDGVDLSQVGPAWLRAQIGVVLQENLLFNRSIHDNIALSGSMPRARVMAAARLAGADDFVSRLPRGYDTIIEERGANLSGGQRQRLAIARALAMNPPMLIFDEATSALDYESERIIQKNMLEIVKGRTVIIIAHRLQAVRPCHRIVGVDEGRIVEIGAHDELLRRNGLYAHLWALQNDLAGA